MRIFACALLSLGVASELNVPQVEPDFVHMNPAPDLQGLKFALLLHEKEAKQSEVDARRRFEQYGIDYIDFKTFDTLANRRLRVQLLFN